MKKTTPKKLEDEPLWKETNALAELLYTKLDSFPSDEKWYSASKLRYAIVDLVFTLSQALGSGSLVGSEYEWRAARKHASSMKAMYRFAGRNKFIDLDPSVMVRMDDLIKSIDLNINDAQKATKETEKRDMEPWLEKYRIWKEISHES